MPWIRTVSVDDAAGRLARSYRAAIERAGRVFGIVRTMSLRTRRCWTPRWDSTAPS